jgi:hypothetical protein
MSDSSSTSSGGIGICGMTFIVFLVLKLAEYGPVASWSWWYITAPLWGPLAALMTFMLICGLVYAIKTAFS